VKEELAAISALSTDNAALRLQLSATRAHSRNVEDLVDDIRSQHSHALTSMTSVHQVRAEGLGSEELGLGVRPFGVKG